MRKDWTHWTVYLNRHHTNNWAIGLDYYHVHDQLSAIDPIMARVFQINLLFFNITITRWGAAQWM